MKSLLRTRVGLGLEILVPVAIVAVWWWSSTNSESVYWPPLSDIAQAFTDNFVFDRIASDVLPSMLRLVAGLLIALAVAIPLGVVLAQSPLALRCASPYIEFLRALPGPALIPFGILFVGIGDGMKISLIAFGCLFPILLTTIDGARAIDPVLRDTLRSYGISKRDVIGRALVPAALPYVFAGLRTSLALGLIMVVISEMVASSNGVGFFILDAQRNFDIADMWAGTLLIGVLGYLLNGLIIMAERRILGWHIASRSGSHDPA